MSSAAAVGTTPAIQRAHTRAAPRPCHRPAERGAGPQRCTRRTRTIPRGALPFPPLSTLGGPVWRGIAADAGWHGGDCPDARRFWIRRFDACALTHAVDDPSARALARRPPPAARRPLPTHRHLAGPSLFHRQPSHTGPALLTPCIFARRRSGQRRRSSKRQIRSLSRMPPRCPRQSARTWTPPASARGTPTK